MNKIRNVVINGILSVSILIVLNIIFTIICFNNFGGFNSASNRYMANIFFYSGNWLSIAARIYPSVVGTDGKVVYDMTGWLDPVIFIINATGWVVIVFLIKKLYRVIKSI